MIYDLIVIIVTKINRQNIFLQFIFCKFVYIVKLKSIDIYIIFL